MKERRPTAAPPDAVERWRQFLRDLDLLALAALLSDAGVELYNRDISNWRVLMDIRDELLDAATFKARQRILDKWLDEGLPFTAEEREARRAQRKARKP